MNKKHIRVAASSLLIPAMLIATAPTSAAFSPSLPSPGFNSMSSNPNMTTHYPTSNHFYSLGLKVTSEIMYGKESDHTKDVTVKMHISGWNAPKVNLLTVNSSDGLEITSRSGQQRNSENMALNSIDFGINGSQVISFQGGQKEIDVTLKFTNDLSKGSHNITPTIGMKTLTGKETVVKYSTKTFTVGDSMSTK